MNPEQIGGLEWMRAQLWERRVVLLSGELDDAGATTATTELMALDAAGDEGITIQVDCRGGTIQAALMIIDTIDLLGVGVHARCLRAEGATVGIVAVAPHRSATPHARFRLGLPDVAFAGGATDVERNAREHQRVVELFVNRLARATGRPFERVEADIERGTWLDADEALVYGLIDEIERPGRSGPRDDRSRFGFA
jgi:ATP-dependent Clp protease, protease subunit